MRAKNKVTAEKNRLKCNRNKKSNAQFAGRPLSSMLMLVVKCMLVDSIDQYETMVEFIYIFEICSLCTPFLSINIR